MQARAFLTQLILWTPLAFLVGGLAGSASAFFLISLDEVTQLRLENPELLYFLPLGGLLIVFLYSRFGKNSERGNNLLLEEVHSSKNHIPFRMAPLVLAGTLITHLFGGSAGREGTAVQMSGALADQLSLILKKWNIDRQILLMMGLAAGFSSVFGTPLAGMIFGLEVQAVGRLRYRALWPCLAASLSAHLICLAWGAHHTPYWIPSLPPISFTSLGLAAIAGAAFGLAAWLFSSSLHRLTALARKIGSGYLRIILGALAVIALTKIFHLDNFIGLGIPQIVESFQTPSGGFDFLIKIILTVITLSVGFKGGEVTPLFFIGATLGSFLSTLLSLPTALLAGMGFVAVFAGAANTPIASILMAVELFGTSSAGYMVVAVIVSYFFSGHTGIYSSQKFEVNKYGQTN